MTNTICEKLILYLNESYHLLISNSMDVDASAVKTEEQPNDPNQAATSKQQMSAALQMLNDNSFPVNNDETDLIVGNKPMSNRIDSELNDLHELNCK